MKQSNVIILPPSSWLITLGNGAILDILYWFLLLADWELTSGYSQVSLGEWISTLLCPCISPSLLPWSHYSWARQAMTGVAGKGDWYKQNESYDPFLLSSLMVNIYSEQNYLHILPPFGDPCPDVLVAHFLIVFLPDPGFELGLGDQALIQHHCSVTGRRFVLWSGNRLELMQSQRGTMMESHLLAASSADRGLHSSLTKHQGSVSQALTTPTTSILPLLFFTCSAIWHQNLNSSKQF